MGNYNSGLVNAPGVYRVGQYSYIANPMLLESGSLIPRFRLAVMLYCERNGCTQKVLSQRTRIPEPRISEYLKGKRPISPSNLRRLCIEMKLPPEKLIGVVELDGIDDELLTG